LTIVLLAVEDVPLRPCEQISTTSAAQAAANLFDMVLLKLDRSNGPGFDESTNLFLSVVKSGPGAASLAATRQAGRGGTTLAACAISRLFDRDRVLRPTGPFISHRSMVATRQCSLSGMNDPQIDP